MFQCLRRLPRTPTISIRFNSLQKPNHSFRAPRLPKSFSSTTRQQAYVRFSTPGQPQKPRNPYDWRTWDSRVQLGVLITGCGMVYYVSHLEQVPDTGRWRFMNTSPSFEAKFGEESRNELRQEFKNATLPPNHPLSRHVRRVVTRILTASNLGVIKGEEHPTSLSPFGLSIEPDGSSWNPDAQFGGAADPGPVYGPKKEWDVIVVNDKKIINAMASPGIVIVFTGILPVCQDEEGLAAVLAHEVGHVVARHTAERLSSQTIVLGFFFILQLFGVEMGISNLISRYALELPNSRAQELEADLIGLRLMSRACYDPAASPAMFTRLAQVESKLSKHINLDFLQTHPSSESRVKLLEKRLQEGYAILAANPNCSNVSEHIQDFKRATREVTIGENGELF